MLAEDLGRFDHVIAMDSLLYYETDDIAAALRGLVARTAGSVVFTVAPRSPLLVAMLALGKLMPRGDRSPVMVPHDAARLACAVGPTVALTDLGVVRSGFYVSRALEAAAWACCRVPCPSRTP